MPQSSQINLNLNYAKQVFDVQKEFTENLSQFVAAKKKLFEKTGVGSEFTDWVSYVKNAAQTALEQQEKLVQEIKSHSNALVVVGIGGSLLGTKAVYEAFTSSYPTQSNKNAPSKPVLFWAGHHLFPEYYDELCLGLEGYSPSIVVISKSGGTTEPALAFRILKRYLENRFGESEAKKRIVIITDAHSGTLLSLAKENNYPTLSIPAGIGGRYSVFTPVGLFPLAFAGMNMSQFILGACHVYEYNCDEKNDTFEKNMALCYAALRNGLYKKNYKIEALCSWTPKTQGVAEWWKQLFGESDGKNGTGLFPASVQLTTDLHSLGQYFQEGERHLFATHLKFNKKYSGVVPSSSRPDGFEFLSGKELSFVQEKAQEGTFMAHTQGKMPVLVWEIPELNEYWLGAFLYTNMLACAIGGYARDINPFNQPGVENYKKNMFALMGKY